MNCKYCQQAKEFFKLWFMQVSRGYTLPMSITNWLVAFSLGVLHNGNILYGILALIGFAFAHMGTNVFDDYVDHKLKVPKQEYKSAYLDNNMASLNSILRLAIIYFAIAFCIGLFLFVKCGFVVALLAICGGIIALSYPLANNFALGELFVGLTFGPMLFMGVFYVMTKTIIPQCIWVSIPVAILTIVVLLVHALMDYDFDLGSGKKNLCMLIGSKQGSLIAIFALLILAFAITLGLIAFDYLPITVGAAYGALIIMIVLYKRMSLYISTSEHAKDDFIINFSLARNIGTIYCLVVTIALLLEKFVFNI